MNLSDKKQLLEKTIKGIWIPEEINNVLNVPTNAAGNAFYISGNGLQDDGINDGDIVFFNNDGTAIVQVIRKQLASEVLNDSGVDGSSAAEALDTLDEDIQTVDSRVDDIVDTFEAGNLVTGFVDRHAGKMTVVGTTYKFNTDNEEIVIYKNGKKYILDAEITFNVTTQGGQYICIDVSDMSLYSVPGWPDYENDILVGYVYLAGSIINWLGRETHGASRNLKWHEAQHENLGAVWRRGGALSINPTTRTLTIGTPITIADEDLVHVINHSASPSSEYEQNLTDFHVNLFYNDGTSWQNMLDTYMQNGFANVYADNGVIASANEGNYIVFFVAYTNNILSPVIAVVGQDEYATANDAANTAFSTAGLPMSEVIPAYKLVFQIASGLPVIEQVLRITSRESGVVGMSFDVTSHDQLFDRHEPDQHPMGAITGLIAALSGKAPTAHTHSLSSLGIGNINNTSDMDKPVSTAQLAALNLKIDKASITQTLDGYSTTLVPSQKAVKEGAEELWAECVKLDTYQPSIGVAVRFNRANNQIQIPIAEDMSKWNLELGDVIQVSGAIDSGNNKMFTIEGITNDGTNHLITVNYEHRNGNGTLSLVENSTLQVINLKRVAKWWYAPEGLGQAWVKVSRSKNTTYTASFNRSIHFFIRYVVVLTVSNITVTLDGKEITSRGEMGFNVGPGGTYRSNNVTDWWERR